MTIRSDFLGRASPFSLTEISGDNSMEQIATTVDPMVMIKLRRKITGISAILLPFTVGGEVDWDGLCAHVARTADAGLTPAVNMDTGYVNLLDEVTRRKVLALTHDTLNGGEFVAGAFVWVQPGGPC